MPINPRNKYLIVAMHASAFLVFIFFATLSKMASRPGFRINIPDILLTYLPTVYVFYGNNAIFTRFLFGKKYVFLALAEIALFGSFLCLYYGEGYWLAPLLNPGTTQPAFHFGTFTIQCLWLFFIYSYFSFGYVFAMQTIKKEKLLRLSESKKAQAEKDRLVAEYSFLRSQINPHFLHNTLSFFYSKSLGVSQELSEGILALSEIMRYSLEDSDTNNGSVSLPREVDNLRKVIKVNQLRFNNKLCIDLAVSGNIEAIRIIPLVLITIVENALKHGDLSNPQDPVVIRIQADENGRQLHFMTSNRKKTGPKELGYGIGMDNVRKRLEYEYHENQRIQVKEDKEHYSVEIDILFIGDEQVGASKKAMEKAS